MIMIIITIIIIIIIITIITITIITIIIIIIGCHIAYSSGIEILAMGQYQTTQLGSMKIPIYCSVHVWTELQQYCRRCAEWQQKPNRILHLKLYTVQVFLCSLRACYA